ncbi:MAG: hypothetical protein K9J13_11645 [Saprospiraceae bacterium]|nr:hypothetical protein [Saprospiraceae bacterium]
MNTEMKQCPRVVKCPLFNNNLKLDEKELESYKNIYCNRGESEFKKCKRFLVSENVIKCGDFVMPDSPESVDDLIERMVEEGVI